MYFLLVQAHQKSLGRQEKILRKQLQKYDLVGEWQRVLHHEEIPRLVSAALEQKFNTVILVGSDSFVQQALPHLIGKDCAVGFLPLGKDNIVLSNWQVEQGDCEQSVEDIAARRVRQFAVAQVNGTPFWYGLSCGMTAHRARLEAQAKESFRHKVKSWSGNRQAQQQVLLDGFQLRVDDLTLLGSGHELMIRFCPYEPLDKSLRLRLLSGKAADAKKNPPEQTSVAGAKIDIRFRAPQPFLIDGAFVELERAEISLRPDALKLIVGKRTLQPF